MSPKKAVPEAAPQRPAAWTRPAQEALRPRPTPPRARRIPARGVHRRCRGPARRRPAVRYGTGGGRCPDSPSPHRPPHRQPPAVPAEPAARRVPPWTPGPDASPAGRSRSLGGRAGGRARGGRRRGVGGRRARPRGPAAAPPDRRVADRRGVTRCDRGRPGGDLQVPIGSTPAPRPRPTLPGSSRRGERAATDGWRHARRGRAAPLLPRTRRRSRSFAARPSVRDRRTGAVDLHPSRPTAAG